MTGSKMFSFRVEDTLIVQQLDAMDDRSSFIRRAVIEKLSADAVDRDAVRRLRAGLTSIADSTALILNAGDDDVPEAVRVGLIGIREAAAMLAAEPQDGERAEPEKGASPPSQRKLPLCVSGPGSHPNPEPDPSKTNPTPPIQEDHP